MYAIRKILIKSILLIPVILIYLAISIISLSFTYYYYFDEENSLLNQLISISFYYSLSMIVINQIFTTITDPGIYGEQKSSKNIEKEFKEFKNQEININKTNHYCSVCKLLKPEFSQHCKICNRCIIQYEKHCPWMFNCIGLKNRKYYYLFLFYSVLGLFISIIALIYKVLHYELTPKLECNDGDFLFKSFKTFKFLGLVINNEIFVIFIQVFCNIKDVIYMLLVIILCILLLLAAFCNLESQTNLIINNKTSIESLIQQRNKENRLSFEEKLKNIKLVLGTSIYLWFLPIVEKIDNNRLSDPDIITLKHDQNEFVENRNELKKFE